MKRELVLTGLFSLRKISDAERVIGGYASVPVIDSDGDLITIDALQDAWESFIASEYPMLSLAHEDVPLGRILPEYQDSYGVLHKSGVDTRGLYVVAKFRKDNKIANEMWNRIQQWGGRGAFSIRAGVLSKPKLTHTEEGKPYHLYGPQTIELHAIGVGQEGVNPESGFTILKMKKPRKRLLVVKS